MGANQYTPTTDEVRAHWENVGFAGTGEEFDRWLEQIRAEAKAEALTEAANDIEYGIPAAQAIQDWLRARAEQIKEEQHHGSAN